MTPDETGIRAKNAYDDPEMWGARYQEFALGSMGTGVAAGDFDNDGLCDLAVVTKTGPCRLFRNLGAWKFEDVTEKAGLPVPPTGKLNPWQQGITFADVDNDGWLDLYLCRFAAPNLLYMNQRNGTFREEAATRGLAVVDASGMAAFCDYDRDGWLDMYLQTNLLDAAKNGSGQGDYLFRNNGNGTFSDVTAEAGISGPTLAHSATWWDFDEDGWPDIYVANDFSGPDRLYRNRGDGTFEDVIDRVLPHTAYSSMGVDLGDVNNDGRVDLFVSDMAATSHEKDQRGMATSRDQNREDGSGAAPQYPRNALYVNTGIGRMIEAAYLAGLWATDWTWSVRFEDLDNDGRIDLHVTNGMNREYQNADLRERMILAQNETERTRIVQASPPMKERHLALRNTGDIAFEDVSTAWGLDHVGISFGAAFGDFDNDGDLDLVYSNYDDHPSVFRNDGTAGNRLIVALRGTRSNRFGVGATVRVETARGLQVRQLVVARGYLSSSDPVLHFGLGDAERIERLTVTWPSGTVQTVDNVQVNGKITIEEAGEAAPGSQHGEEKAGGGSGATTENERMSARPAARTLFTEISTELNLAHAAREDAAEETNPQPLVPFRFHHRGPSLSVLETDGAPVVLLGATRLDPPRLLRRGSDGAFNVAAIPAAVGATNLPDGPALWLEVDGDGHQDVLITKGGAGLLGGLRDFQARLLLGGPEGFRPAEAGVLPTLAISAGAVCAADFDRDGRLDVFVGGRIQPGRYPMPPESALLRNLGGRFENVTAALAPALRNCGMVTSAVWSDVDVDGWIDLVVTLDWGGVRYFRNEQGTRFTDASEASGFSTARSGWWTAVATADFNRDGRPDFAIGNFGLNTPYQATEEDPAFVYYGDLAKSGRPVAVEAYQQRGKIYPRRTRRELCSRISPLQQRFRRNDLYARATVVDLFGEPALAAARKVVVTESRSGVLLSQSDGTYRFAPLPRLAQVAPAQGMVTGDFDGDGNADVYLVHNLFAGIPCVGRFDGGLSQLLRGDGTGGFEPVPVDVSGLVVTGDAKALVTCDLNDDARPDFVVSRNNAATLGFRNDAFPAGAHGLGVRLRGPAGNPTAIGARVTAEYADHTGSMREVCAGDGYYSQSSPVSYFSWREGNPIRTINVRWPTGESTRHEVSPNPKQILVIEQTSSLPPGPVSTN